MTSVPGFLEAYATEGYVDGDLVVACYQALYSDERAANTPTMTPASEIFERAYALAQTIQPAIAAGVEFNCAYKLGRTIQEGESIE